MRSKGLGTNIAVTFLRQGIGVVFALGIVTIIARTMGPEGQGKYALAIFLPTFLVLLFNLGVPSANAYFLGRGDVSVIAALRSSARLWLLLGAAGTAIGAGVVFFFADAWFPGIPDDLLWIALAGFPVALIHAFLASLFQGLQDFDRYNVVMLFQPVAMLILTVVVIFVLGWGLAGVVFAYVVAWLLTSIATRRVLTPHLTAARSNVAESRITRYANRCVGYGWKAQIANNLAFLTYRSNTVLINFFMSPAATGLFVPAVILAEKIWMLSQATSQVLLPRLSELHTDEDRRRRLTPLATKLVFVMSLFISTALFVAARPLIVGVFGPEFEPSVGALRWLLPGVVLLTVARGISIDLAARGRVDLNLYVAIATVVSNIAGNIILIPRYGINGAAIATTFSYIVNLVLKFVFYRRLSGNEWHRLVFFRRADIDLIRGKIDSLKGDAQ